MKQLKLKLLFTVLMSMVGQQAFADWDTSTKVQVDGIYYYLDNASNLAQVMSVPEGYSGYIKIPSDFIYNGNNYVVTEIRSYAFQKCSGLTSVEIPNSVTSIGYMAFFHCSGLTSVTIPNSVTSIGSDAFSGTAWYDNQPNGLVYAGNIAYKYKGTMPENTSITIKEGTSAILGNVFNGCSGLISVTIPNSVTSIGSGAFLGCSDLTSITIPNSVISIGSGAFSGCIFEKIEFINNSNLDAESNNYWGARIVSKEYDCAIADGVLIKYYGNYNTVTIPSSVTSIGYNVFSKKPIKTIWLTNTPPQGYSYAQGTVNYVANSQYSSLSNVKEYKFLSSMFEVDGIRYVPVSPSERTCDAIDCVYDESVSEVSITPTVSFKGVNMKVQNVQPYTFYQNTNIKKVSIDIDGSIGEYVFSGCYNLQTAVFGQNVTGIGDYAFNGCSKLESIRIPDAVTFIGQNAFSYCVGLTTMKIGEGTNTIGNYAFSGCSSLPGITIPSSVNSIGNYAFSGCKGLKTVIIEDSETDITLNLGCNGNNPLFADCPLDSVYIGRNISYSTASDFGYSPFYRNTKLRSVTITDKETEISENEFYGCTNLQNVLIGDGVTFIGNWAFSGCSSLKNFSFGTQVKTIGKEAFSDCTAVTSITSKAQTPPTCDSQALDDINKWECKLYVPEGHVADYQAADQWKEFFFVEEGDGGGSIPIDPSGNKCATPTIEYVDGKLSFSCETEGVKYIYTIVPPSITSGEGENAEFSTLYTIKVYATKDGCEDSDVATKEINVGGGTGIKGDVNEDGTVNGTDIQEVINIIVNAE